VGVGVGVEELRSGYFIWKGRRYGVAGCWVMRSTASPNLERIILSALWSEGTAVRRRLLSIAIDTSLLSWWHILMSAAPSSSISSRFRTSRAAHPACGSPAQSINCPQTHCRSRIAPSGDERCFQPTTKLGLPTFRIPPQLSRQRLAGGLPPPTLRRSRAYVARCNWVPTAIPIFVHRPPPFQPLQIQPPKALPSAHPPLFARLYLH
jgi:hypothetical protein